MNNEHQASNRFYGVCLVLLLPILLAGLIPGLSLASDVGGPDQLDIPVEKQHQKAYLKYRMARMAIEEGDMKLAHRFLHEALAANPENSALRYEFARFLAERGKGRKALEVLENFKGSLELTAKVEYLKEKLKVAEGLNGSYVEIEKSQTAVGQPAKKMRADGLLVINLGQIKWGQRIANKVVTQHYSFPVHNLLSGETSFKIKLKWEGIEDAGVSSYVPDRKDPVLLASKTKQGWALALKVSDEKGGKGSIVFSPQNAGAGSNERHAK